MSEDIRLDKDYKLYETLLENNEWYSKHKGKYVGIVDEIVHVSKDKKKLMNLLEYYPNPGYIWKNQ